MDEPAFGTQIPTEPNNPMPKKVRLPSKSLVKPKSPSESKSKLSPKVIGAAVLRDRVVTSLTIKEMEVMDGDIYSYQPVRTAKLRRLAGSLASTQAQILSLAASCCPNKIYDEYHQVTAA